MTTYTLNYDGNEYKIFEAHPAALFRAIGNGIEIFFQAEGRNGGTYFHIKSVTKNGRTYTAQRYHYPYIAIVREASFILRQNNELWDYVKQCPLYPVTITK